MTKQEIFEKCTNAGILQVATIEGDQPRVRTVLLYRADEDGIIFHTGDFKDLYKQLVQNSKVEYCFNCENTMIRISGEVEIVEERALKEEIVAHPSRAFLRAWKDNDMMPNFWESLKVVRLSHGIATVWSMDKNFAPKEYIQL